MSQSPPPYRLPAMDASPARRKGEADLQSLLYRDLIGVLRLAHLVNLVLILALFFLPSVCRAELRSAPIAESVLESVHLNQIPGLADVMEKAGLA